MSETPTRWPLAWPAHRPRAKVRKRGKFQGRSERGWLEPITVARAMKRLEDEVERLGGRNLLLSTNIETRLDGQPRSGAPQPADPGCCLYFSLKGEPMALACDAYTEVAQNIAALAAHIESTRAIARHGVASTTETLQAFRALPAPPPEIPKAPWWEVLGIMRDFATEDTVSGVHRALTKRAASQGDEAALKALNVARDEALAAIRARTSDKTAVTTR